MQINEKLFDTKKQNRNDKLHMFQRTEEKTEPKQENNPELDSLFLDNLNKIKKNFRSFRDDKNLEVKTNSLVSCAKGLIEINSKNLTTDITQFLENLKRQNAKIEREEVFHPENETIYEEVVNFQNNIDINENEEKNVNIDELIKTSEKELLNKGDQKMVLMSLIDDINSNNDNQIFYDEEKFAKNITAIIEETQGEIEKDEHISILSDEPIVFNAQNVKKTRISLTLIIIIIILLGIAGYVYRDTILELLKQYGIVS